MNTLAELRKISQRLRVLASRAAHSPHDHAKLNLKRLADYVESTPMLKAELDCAPKPDNDPLGILEASIQAGTRLPFPVDPLDELGLIHSLIVALADDEEFDFWQRAHGYGDAPGLQECAQELLHELVNPYSSYFETFIANLIIDLEETGGRSRVLDVKVHAPSQINIAHDQSNIQATQNVREEAQQVLTVARELIAAIQEYSTDHEDERAEEAYSLASQAVVELEHPEPKAGRLDRIRSGLSTLSTAAELPGKITALITRLGEMLDKLQGVGA